MERISIIKNFFDLVGLTKIERISLIKALMEEWNLTAADITTPMPSPAGIAEDFDIASELPSKQEAATPVVIDFSEENTAQADDVQEQVSSEAPAEQAPSVKRRGRRKKAEINNEAPATAVDPPVKRRGRRKKTDIINDAPASVVEEPVKRRGRRKKTEENNTPVSQEAKPAVKRGRKKKSENSFTESVENVSEAEAPENEETPPENVSANDEDLIAETAGITDLRMLLEDEPPVRSKTTKRRNPAFRYLADYPALKELTVGRDYPFEYLYQWEGCNLLSPYVLSGLMPIGIYIPYKSLVFGLYRGFIISIYDEQVIENIDDACEEARKKEPIDNEEWSIMNAIQFGVVKTSSEILNRMLTKIGGDRLKQTYRLLSPKSNHVTGIGKFRYAIDVK